VDFLLDENVPRHVGVVLADAGHDVTTVVDHLPAGSPDQLVATAAMDMDRILISHDRDMRRVERAFSQGVQGRFPRLSRLQLCCEEAAAARRVSMFLPVITAEFERVQGQEDNRLLIEIGDRRVRIWR
jgi:predicted nuclease of predicted toxin-antitoxin system